MLERVLKKANKSLAPEQLFFAPEYIVLGVNNVCNLHCKMCDVGTQNLETNFAQNLVGASPLNMPLDLFKRIADQTASYFPKAKLGYAFTEPLVYPDLRDSLIYAKEKGLSTTITTNALNLKRKAVDILDGGVSELFISLDGLQETHNFIRGHKKSFQKAIEGIEYITQSTSSPEISVYCVITEWNYKELEDFADFFNRQPIKHLGFMHQNFVTEQMADKHNALFGKKYRATHSNIEETDFSQIDLTILNHQIQSIKNKNYKFKPSFSPELEGLDVLDVYYNYPEKKLGKTCNDVFTNMMIKSDGTIIPSHGRCYNITMGNLYQNNLKDIWNSSLYGRFRKDLLKNGGLLPACNRCCSAF